MPRNPYVAAWRLQRKNQRRVAGPWGALATNALPLAVAALLVPFVEPVFLGFLIEPEHTWGGGLEAIGVRGAWLIVAVLAVDVYGALIRSPDRPVLDLHPVDGAEVAAFEMIRVGRERWWLPVALWIALSPVASATVLGWVLLGVLFFGAFALGLRGSVWMHLAAIDVAESPRWGPLLDLVRGANPRAQAAFLYAPGAVLFVTGAILWLAAEGIRIGWGGQPLAWLLLAVPPVAAALAWLPVPALARANWFKATGVLADIDARWAALEGRGDDSRRAYFDWVVRWLPKDVARYALKDLRHGWRVRRPWLLGPWLAGAVAAFAGWSAGPWAPGNAAAFVVAATWAFATIGAVLDRDDPEFLRATLPPEPVPRRVARGVVLALWVHTVVWLPFFAVWLRHGFGASLTVVALAAASLVVAVPIAMAAGASRAWGPWLYGPLAVLAGAATVAWSFGGSP